MRRNLMTYNGRQDTNVITDTFHKKSHDQMNSQSEKQIREIEYDDGRLYKRLSTYRNIHAAQLTRLGREAN